MNNLSISPFPKQIEAPRKIDQVEQFAAGRERDIQEAQMVGLTCAGAALDDVGRDRHSRAADLAEEPVAFALRKVRRPPVDMLREMEAVDLFAQGRRTEAFRMMDRAAASQARMPKPIGRPFSVKGADELYGELLLQAGRPKEAVVWFDRTLARTPNRSKAVLGLARAYRNSGDIRNARATYQRFLANWRLADPGLPEVVEAREAVR